MVISRITHDTPHYAKYEKGVIPLNWQIASALIVALLGSGLIQYFINRHDGKGTKLDSIETKLDKHIDDDDRRDIIQCRVRILRFCDDLRLGIERSEASYNQVMEDIDHYDRYCETHDGFRNGVATASSEYIIEKYKQHLALNDFIA